MIHFPCIACGLCCKKAHLIPELGSLIQDDGQCLFYDCETHKCKNYQKRPEICNVDKMYETVFHSMSRKDFYLANLRVCYALNLEAAQWEDANKILSAIHQVQKDEFVDC